MIRGKLFKFIVILTAHVGMAIITTLMSDKILEKMRKMGAQNESDDSD